MTAVVNRRFTQPNPDDVYIGRPSRWGTPFVVSRHGSRAQVIDLYRRKLAADVRARRISVEDLARLAGKRLVCWCAPSPCHGDVLAEAAEWAASGGDPERMHWTAGSGGDLG